MKAGLVGDFQLACAECDPPRQKPLRRRSHALVSHAIERRIDFAGEIGRQHHLDAGAVERRAVGLQRAVDIERDVAVAAHDGERLALEDAEVGRVAQIVALPGVAVDQHRVEPGFAHRVGETLDPLSRDHDPLRLLTTPAATS